jgi:SPP1 family predicted phage head-tail adaptor
MKFNALALIQVYSETTDGYGQPVKAWADSSSIWGQLTPTQGGEKREKYGVERSESLTFRTYYRSDLTAKDRLKIGTQIYEIDNLMQESNRVFMALTLKATDGR